MSSVRLSTTSSDLIKLLCGIGSVVVLFGLVEWKLSQVPNLYSQKQKLLNELAPNLRVLVLGGCEAQSAFKPSEWELSGLNMATANQSAVVSAQIFSKALPRMASLRTLVLPASYLSWQGSYELHQEYWRNFFYVRFLHIRGELSVFRFLDMRTFSLFFLYWPFSRGLLLSPESSGHPTYRPLQGERMPFLTHLPRDGFLPFDPYSDFAFEPETVRQMINLWHRSLKLERLKENQKALRRIVEQARERGVRVVFVKTPTAEVFRQKMLAEGISLENDALALLSEVGNVTVLDFRSNSSEALFNRDDFADPVHLTESGAIKLSKLIRPHL